MNTAPKTAANRPKMIDPRPGNVEAGPESMDELSQPSRSEVNWLKTAVPTIGTAQDDREGGAANPAAQA